MSWLVEADRLAGLDVADASPLVSPSRLDAKDMTIVESGESMVRVSDFFEVRWVYSWMGFRELPSDVFLRRGLVDRLVRAAQALPDALELVILDGWRSRAFQRELVEYYSEHGQVSTDGFVSRPDTDFPPPHTTGGAVDLTLSWRGVAMALGSDFDEFSPLSATVALEGAGPSKARALRRVLGEALVGAGLVPYPLEWWHWSYGDQLWAAGTNAEAACYDEVKRF